MGGDRRGGGSDGGGGGGGGGGGSDAFAGERLVRKRPRGAEPTPASGVVGDDATGTAPPGRILTPASAACWFCLSTGKDPHLVVSVGTHIYAALAKGALTPSHVLLIPIRHCRSSLSLPAAAAAEMATYRSALAAMHAAAPVPAVAVAWERVTATRAAGAHAHAFVQVVGVPRAAAAAGRPRAVVAAAAADVRGAGPGGLRLAEVPPAAASPAAWLRGHKPVPYEYFWLDVPGGGRWAQLPEVVEPLSLPGGGKSRPVGLAGVSRMGLSAPGGAPVAGAGAPRGNGTAPGVASLVPGVGDTASTAPADGFAAPAIPSAIDLAEAAAPRSDASGGVSATAGERGNGPISSVAITGADPAVAAAAAADNEADVSAVPGVVATPPDTSARDAMDTGGDGEGASAGNSFKGPPVVATNMDAEEPAADAAAARSTEAPDRGANPATVHGAADAETRGDGDNTAATLDADASAVASGGRTPSGSDAAPPVDEAVATNSAADGANGDALTAGAAGGGGGNMERDDGLAAVEGDGAAVVAVVSGAPSSGGGGADEAGAGGPAAAAAAVDGAAAGDGTVVDTAGDASPAQAVAPARDDGPARAADDGRAAAATMAATAATAPSTTATDGGGSGPEEASGGVAGAATPSTPPPPPATDAPAAAGGPTVDGEAAADGKAALGTAAAAAAGEPPLPSPLPDADAARAALHAALRVPRLVVHPLQFGRAVAAALLGCPERDDWKACVVTEPEEAAAAEAFRAAFAPYDPMLRQ